MPTDLPEPNHPPATPDQAISDPDTLYLAPSKLRWISTLVVSTGILALDVSLLAQGGSPGIWMLLILFGLMAGIAITQLIPGLGGLWLDREGFHFRVAVYTRRRQWSEITEIASSSAGLFHIVGYHLVKDDPSKPREVLPETYGVGAHELGRVMNWWRNRALGIQPSAPVPVGLETAVPQDGNA
jgi:hypothetical protein